MKTCKSNAIRIFALLSVATVAIACEMIAVAPPAHVVQVKWYLFQTAPQAVGNEMQEMYGDLHNDSEVFVEVAYKLRFLPGAGIIPFSKPCGMNYEDAGNRTDLNPETAEAGGSGSPFNPGYGNMPFGGSPLPGCIAGCEPPRYGEVGEPFPDPNQQGN